MSLLPAIDLLQAVSTELSDSDAADVIGILDNIAVLLRQDDLRREASTTSLPSSLVRLLHSKDDDCLFQVGRVAANLAADCDAGRLALVSAGYPGVAIDVFGSHDTESLLISLLNMVIGNNEQVVAALRPRLHDLLRLGSQRRNIHLWTIADVVASTGMPVDDEPVDQYLIEAIGSDEEETALIWQIAQNVSQGSTALAKRAVDLRTEESLRFIAATTVPYCDDPFWASLRSWLHDGENPDLQATSLIAFGNAVNDSTASAVLQIVPDCLPLLNASSPDQVQHALLGLIRNLSVKVGNRSDMIEMGVMDKILQMGVWEREKDRLGSVQGSAIVIMKNLCRETAAVHRFDLGAQQKLVDLILRSNEQPLKWEGTRVFVNLVRSAYGDKTDISLEPRSGVILVDMLRTAKEHPLLVNEAIVALTLLATKDSDDIVFKDPVFHQDLSQIASPDSQVAEEIKQNATTLLRIVNQAHLDHGEKE